MSSPDRTIATRQQPAVKEGTAALQTPAMSSVKNKIPQIYTDSQGLYNIVKVRKPDGTIGKVKRRIPISTDKASSKATPKVGSTPSFEAATVESPPKTASNPVPRPNPFDATSKPANTLIRDASPSLKAADRNVSPQIPKTVPGIASTAAGSARLSNEIQSPLAETKTITTADQSKQVISSLQPAAAAPLATKPSGPDVATAMATSATPLDTRATQARGGMFHYRGLSHLHEASRIFGVFSPDYNIGDYEDGDEDIDDDDYDSDESTDIKDGDQDDSKNNNAMNDNRGYGDRSEIPVSSNTDFNAAETARATTSLLPLASQQPPQYQANQPKSMNTAEESKDIDVEAKTSSPRNNIRTSEKEINEKGVNAGNETSERGPRSLHKRYVDWSRYIIWALMVALPSLFIIMGILTAALTNKPYPSTYGQNIQQAIKVSITAWPIIFAAIAAQSLRALATYKVERGIRMMTLEQLISSQSVASCVKQPFRLRRFDLISVALLCLWSLSPIASQAMLRMSYQGSKISITKQDVYYLNTVNDSGILSSPIDYGGTPIASTTVQYLDDADGVFYNDGVIYGDSTHLLMQTSFLPGGQYQSVFTDSWDNPKIPHLGYVIEAQVPIVDGWHSTADLTDPEDFSSGFGIPMERMTAVGTYDFVISSAYLDLHCDFLNKTYVAAINATGVQLKSNPGAGGLLMTMTNYTTSEPGSLVFAYGDGNTDHIYSYSVCHFTPAYVDSLVSCTVTAGLGASGGNSLDCAVSGVRPTAVDNIPSTPAPMTDFSQAFLLSAGFTLARWLYNPANLSAFVLPPIVDQQDLTVIGLQNFTKRLGLAFNNYWQISFAPDFQTGGFKRNAYLLNTTTDILKSKLGNFTQELDVYKTSWGWLITLLTSSVILLVAGVASVIWDSMTIVPDILGFASSVARKSKYVDLPKFDTTMGGAERARLLGEVRVMMQDVKPNAQVGRIALGTAHNKAAKLRPGRLYK